MALRFRRNGIEAGLALAMLAAAVPATPQLCDPWQVVAGNPGTDLRGVAWGGGHWLAVGELGTTITSADGTTWRRPTPLAPFGYSAVAWGEPGFVAFSADPIVAHVSADGLTWRDASFPGEWSVVAAAWGAGRWVAFGLGGGVFASQDGVAWHRVWEQDGFHIRLSGLIFDGARFVAVGTRFTDDLSIERGVVVTSSDGETWELHEGPPATALNAVAWNGTRYAAAGHRIVNGFTSGVLLASDDGLTWNEVAGPFAGEPLAVAAGGAAFVAVGYGNPAWYSADGLSWSAAPLGGDLYLTAAAWSGDRFVAVGAHGAILSSGDGLTWRSVVDFQTLADVVWTGRRYVAVGKAGAVMLSGDGAQWQAVVPIDSANLARVVFTGTKLQSFTASGRVFESPDGSSWVARPALSTPSPYVAFGAGVYVTIADRFSGHATLKRSVDLSTWTTVSASDFEPQAVIWTGARFVAAGVLAYQYPAGDLRVSDDGLLWTSRNGWSTLRYGIEALAGNPAGIVGSDLAGYLYRCEGDGTRCREASLLGFFGGVHWAGSRYIGMSSSGGGYAASWDGLQWEQQAVIAAPEASAVAAGGTSIVGVGDFIMRTTCPTSGEPLYLPAAAHNLGLNHTQWKTDAFVANLGATQAHFTLELLPRSREGLAPVSTTFTLAPGAMATYADVVSSVFNLQGAGTLRVTPIDGAITASERVYQVSTTATLGQHGPGLPASAALSQGQRAALIGLAESASVSAGNRTNIGLVNACALRILVAVELYRGDGALLGTRSYVLRPYESIQRTRIFAEVTADELPSAYAIVSTATPGARYFAYAFLVDNVTGAPELVLPQLP